MDVCYFLLRILARLELKISDLRDVFYYGSDLISRMTSNGVICVCIILGFSPVQRTSKKRFIVALTKYYSERITKIKNI